MKKTGVSTTPKLSSRNQEINSGAPRVFAPVLASRVVRFRRCNGPPPPLVSFPRRGAVICHVVGGERLRCICNFTRHSPPAPLSLSLSHTRSPFLLDLFFPLDNIQLRCSSPPLPSPPSLAALLFVSENAPRNSRSFGERERERGGGGRGRERGGRQGGQITRGRR